MKRTTGAAWRLRQSNPVPSDAFSGAASDSLGRAAFERIVASATMPPSALSRGGRIRARLSVSGPARSRKRLALWFAAPAIAAAATAWAVALSGVSTLSQPTYTLDALLKVHPPAHPGDAAAVLRQLAARAAAQPAQALGPVEYSSNRQWEDIGDNVPLNLNYLSRNSSTNQAWDAVSGASAVHIVRNSDGKVFTSSYPATRWSAQEGAWINPATFPDNLPALRRHLLYPPGQPAGFWTFTYAERHRQWNGKLGPPQNVGTGEFTSRLAAVRDVRAERKQLQKFHDVITNLRFHKIGPFGYLTWRDVVGSNALMFMTGEPLPPAVRSAMLLLLAQNAAHPDRGSTVVDLGTAIDRLGRTGVAIAGEQANSAGPELVGVGVTIFDPRTGAVLDAANAQCKIPLGAIPRTTGQCAPTDYTEYNLPKAVPAVPHYRAHIPRLYLGAGGPYI